jgi:cytoskeletal protein RodZ
MFALGSSLRDARLRQGLQVEEVEEQTRISRRYLRALEEERFELLPGDAYAKAFLGSYADFLGLDAKAFTDEYSARLSKRAPEPALRFRPLPRKRPVSLVVLVSLQRWPLLVAVGVAALIAVLAWQYGAPNSPPKPLSQPTAPAPAQPPTLTTPPTTPTPTLPPPTPALTLKAVRGPCWIDVHLYSASGKIVYINTLAQGVTVRFSLRRPLWIRLGAPSNLNATIGTRPITGLPTQPANFLATKTGLRPA